MKADSSPDVVVIVTKILESGDEYPESTQIALPSESGKIFRNSVMAKFHAIYGFGLMVPEEPVHPY